MSFTLLIVIIVLAFLFDFINGFHDAANSIATIVSTKVLSPLQAVLWAAFFNFLAYAVFELKIADTIAKVVDTNAINLQVILAGVVAAILWNLLNLVPRNPFQLISHPDRRVRRSCCGSCRMDRCKIQRNIKNCLLYFPGTNSWHDFLLYLFYSPAESFSKCQSKYCKQIF